MTLELLPELCQVMWLPRVTKTILFVTILFYLYKLIGKCPQFPGGSDGKKNLPAMQETQVPSLGREDPLEKEMATHSSILAWRILWTEKLGRLQTTGSQRVAHNRGTNTHDRNAGHLLPDDSRCHSAEVLSLQQPHLSNGKAGP